MFSVFTEGLRVCIGTLLGQLTMFATRTSTTSFTRLKALKYRELRALYPHLASHCAYTACQDAATRAKSFSRMKRRGLASRERPEVKSITIWLNDHLRKPRGYGTYNSYCID